MRGTTLAQELQVASFPFHHHGYHCWQFESYCKCSQVPVRVTLEWGLGTRLLNKYLYITWWGAYCCDPLSDALLVQAAPTGVEVVGRVLTVLAHPALSTLTPRTLTASTQVIRHSCTHEQGCKVCHKLAYNTCWNFHSGWFSVYLMQVSRYSQN